LVIHNPIYRSCFQEIDVDANFAGFGGSRTGE
jgi:hypothetical protein